jgi:outer membrane receptor protein involved in Fe transport
MVTRSSLYKNGLYVLALVLITTVCTRYVYAQVAGASLTGTVKDPSGSIIPNAQVSITDVATGIVRTVSTDSAGLYIAPNLLPGNYEVKVAAIGFSTQLLKGIALTVGTQQLLDITMRVGQVSQTVEVTTEAPTVELTSSTVSDQVNAITIRELPLNGRSWTDLANLQPGVITAESHVSGDPTRGFGAQISISGARPQQNNYRLDGVSINDYANGGPGSSLGGNLGVDAIQEFSVLTTNYSAEYGKTSGGVVNAITRSGTNQFHGSAYEFIRNSALDARNFFDPAQIPPFRRNQFGVAAGAPIRKDKTFIFADYESIRQSLGTSTLDQVLSPAAHSGILNFASGTPFPGGCVATSVANQCQVKVSPAVVPYLPLDPLPTPGTPLIGLGNTGNFTEVGQQVTNEEFFTFRVDQKLTDNDSLFGTYSFDNSPQSSPDVLGDVSTIESSRVQIAALEETHIFSPSVVNTVRFGFNRSHTSTPAGVSPLVPAAANPSLGWAPNENATHVQVPGITGMGPGVGPPIYVYRWNAFQGYDDASVTRGLHTFKFGVSVERDQLNQITYTGDYYGTFTFRSIADFLTNVPSRARGVVPTLETPRYMRQTIVGTYLQDDWRFRPNLTLNLGVRYEMSTVPSETKGKQSNLETISAASPHLGSPFFSNPTLRNFEPRVGFSWDPFKTGKTAVRGGFGMFDALPMLYQTVTMNGRAYPFFHLASTSSVNGNLNGTFPNGALPIIEGLPAGTAEMGYVEPNPHRNYVMQWNFNIQREITPSLTAMVAYVGSRGVHMAFRTDDANVVLPTLTSAGYLWPNPVGSGIPINPNAGAIRFMDWGGSSAYHSLQIGIVKKMSRGFQIQGSFTWNKSIDDNSGSIAGDTLGNSISSLSWFDLRLDRGVSDFNIPRTLVLNGTWNIPGVKSATGLLGVVANGWELGTIFKVQDGTPFTPTFGTDGDPLGLNSSDPYDYPNRLGGSGCQTLTNPGNVANYIKTQCFAVPTAPTPAFYAANCATTFAYPVCINLRGNSGRNDIYGPGLVSLDSSLFKNFPIHKISEAFVAQFRIEAFNIINHANFQSPANVVNTDIFSSDTTPNNVAGLLTGTTTSARQVQFALKLTW